MAPNVKPVVPELESLSGVLPGISSRMRLLTGGDVVSGRLTLRGVEVALGVFDG